MSQKTKIGLTEDQQDEINSELWDAAMDFMDDLGEIEQKRDKAMAANWKAKQGLSGK